MRPENPKPFLNRRKSEQRNTCNAFSPFPVPQPFQPANCRPIYFWLNVGIAAGSWNRLVKRWIPQCTAVVFLHWSACCEINKNTLKANARIHKMQIYRIYQIRLHGTRQRYELPSLFSRVLIFFQFMLCSRIFFTGAYKFRIHFFHPSFCCH